MTTRSAIERLHVARNLQHNVLDVVFDEQAVRDGRTDFDYGEQLMLLYRFAAALEKSRGQDPNRVQRTDYSFYVEDDRVRIERRKRGSPVDKVVSELMILVNAQWARLLADAGLPGLFRTQASGKVKMSTVPARHEGLGLDQYIWASSPLRRYADLVNQRQLISILRGVQPAFAPNDQELFEIMRGFELAYEAYADFQRTMERYWCLRWLLQEGVTEIAAEVVRDDLVRLESVPLVCRAHALPSLPPAGRVQVAVSDVDLMELTLRCEYKETLDLGGADPERVRVAGATAADAVGRLAADVRRCPAVDAGGFHRISCIPAADHLCGARGAGKQIGGAARRGAGQQPVTVTAGQGGTAGADQSGRWRQ